MSSVSQFRVDEEALNYHKHQTTKIYFMCTKTD